MMYNLERLVGGATTSMLLEWNGRRRTVCEADVHCSNWHDRDVNANSFVFPILPEQSNITMVVSLCALISRI